VENGICREDVLIREAGEVFMGYIPVGTDDDGFDGHSVEVGRDRQRWALRRGCWKRRLLLRYQD